MEGGGIVSQCGHDTPPRHCRGKTGTCYTENSVKEGGGTAYYEVVICSKMLIPSALRSSLRAHGILMPTHYKHS